MQFFLEKLWYTRKLKFLQWILWPLSFIFQIITALRRFFISTCLKKKYSVPIVVVGNLTVGGVGKTPLVIALVAAFQKKGLRVGVVSRGYKASVKNFPHDVLATDKPSHVGDEPLLIKQRSNCPVVIAPKRTQAVEYLIKKYACQIIISDDGLQHYRMGRAVEIVVIDGERGLGNGLCLPAGPLREHAKRLQYVDFIVANGGKWPGAFLMDVLPGPLQQLISNKTLAVSQLVEPIIAIAAIGHPQRFFETLRRLNMEFKACSFPDHYAFTPYDLEWAQNKTVIMTEKDAVKCRPFANDKWYFLPVNAQLNEAFWQALWAHEEIKKVVFP